MLLPTSLLPRVECPFCKRTIFLLHELDIGNKKCSCGCPVVIGFTVCSDGTEFNTVREMTKPERNKYFVERGNKKYAITNN